MTSRQADIHIHDVIYYRHTHMIYLVGNCVTLTLEMDLGVVCQENELVDEGNQEQLTKPDWNYVLFSWEVKSTNECQLLLSIRAYIPKQNKITRFFLHIYIYKHQ